jgi:hypothetical protein
MFCEQRADTRRAPAAEIKEKSSKEVFQNQEWRWKKGERGREIDNWKQHVHHMIFMAYVTCKKWYHQWSGRSQVTQSRWKVTQYVSWQFRIFSLVLSLFMLLNVMRVEFIITMRINFITVFYYKNFTK